MIFDAPERKVKEKVVFCSLRKKGDSVGSLVRTGSKGGVGRREGKERPCFPASVAWSTT